MPASPLERASLILFGILCVAAVFSLGFWGGYRTGTSEAKSTTMTTSTTVAPTTTTTSPRDDPLNGAKLACNYRNSSKCAWSDDLQSWVPVP